MTSRMFAGSPSAWTSIGENGRTPLGELAEVLVVSVDTASRRLNRLLESGQLVLRCDLARSLSGSPVAVTLFGSVAAEHLESTAEELAKLPEIRQCLALAGPINRLMGRLLDPDGRAVGFVPMNLWA
ncbi:Lrp/AsnC family transcriptional regulator [Streptomyces sp. NPDC057565]|uniref:Lrp/AsnC family transcriptional regulator n=1 Tax=Streptomyces sp. NPDC057565 TaxID=3346169 RepID=UPI0036A719D2